MNFKQRRQRVKRFSFERAFYVYVYKPSGKKKGNIILKIRHAKIMIEVSLIFFSLFFIPSF